VISGVHETLRDGRFIDDALPYFTLSGIDELL
jgi:hypothetical protein